MKIEQICILGGSGFIGSHLTAHLVNRGYRIKLLTRRRERSKRFLVYPMVKLIEADVYDPAVLQREFADCDAVINLIGMLNGSEQAFQKTHAELPARIVATCRELGIARYLHMSAINAAVDGPSLYLRSKGEGEAAALAGDSATLHVTALRPSIVFGPDDHFFNLFANLLKISPVFPLACPQTRFAPVYVNDVVAAFEVALTAADTFGKSLDLCGPNVYTFHELLELTAQMIGRKRFIIDLPDRLARLQAQVFQRVPGQPFTMDNYRSLQRDSVCSENGLNLLGIEPCAVESIMPDHFAGRDAKALRYSQIRNNGRLS